MVPDVSVVMSVYNDAQYLRGAIESILAQEDVHFEFIIVNDGATDESPAILDEYARQDNRIRLLHQENQGLTRSLIRGCAEAQGEFIARQDADDLSMPGRLSNQRELLCGNPRLSFVSSWAEVIGPEDEVLLTYKRPKDPEAATHQLLHERQGPPGHGSVMFRRDRYEEVGGYRPEFYYAQDADLWLRLGAVGQLGYAQEVLFRYRINETSISGRRHSAKIPFAKLVDECYAARCAGRSENLLLARSKDIMPGKWKVARNSEEATLYFIGRCLLSRGDARAAKYLSRCVRQNPLHLRAWACLLIAKFK